MPKEQQMARNIFLQNRLKRYTVETWATEFLSVLNSKNEGVTDFTSQRIDKSIIENIVQKYQSAKRKLLFFDYDGTLVGFHKDPQKAMPTEALYEMLDNIHAQEDVDLFLIKRSR